MITLTDWLLILMMTHSDWLLVLQRDGLLSCRDFKKEKLNCTELVFHESQSAFSLLISCWSAIDQLLISLFRAVQLVSYVTNITCETQRCAAYLRVRGQQWTLYIQCVCVCVCVCVAYSEAWCSCARSTASSLSSLASRSRDIRAWSLSFWAANTSSNTATERRRQGEEMRSHQFQDEFSKNNSVSPQINQPIKVQISLFRKHLSSLSHTHIHTHTHTAQLNEYYMWSQLQCTHTYLTNSGLLTVISLQSFSFVSMCVGFKQCVWKIFKKSRQIRSD